MATDASRLRGASTRSLISSVLVILVTVASSACIGEVDEPATRSGISATSTSEATNEAEAPREWVAVYEVSPYSEERRQAFIAAAGTAVFEGPALCFDGLSERAEVSAPGPEASVLALIAPTEENLRDAMTHLSETPRLVAEFPSFCRD